MNFKSSDICMEFINAIRWSWVGVQVRLTEPDPTK